jgi:3-phenylpropionate/trans-cinnamate dioxygenase ferredoxin reductase subunit
VSARYDVVIVGAGHAGAQAAASLRQGNFAGTIALIGDEACLPYERPPLSKDYLSGGKTLERILLRPAGFWSEKQIARLCGRRVLAVDPSAHRVSLEDGSMLDYGTLVWAAGGAARRLTCPGNELAGVHTMRTSADVDRIRNELGETVRVVVIGGGFIGLEAAATLRALGKQVTVVEALDRVLARVAGEPLSRFYEEEHRARGVNIRLNAQVDCIEGSQGRVSGVRLADGHVLPADMVIAGIGIVPVIDPLLAAGAQGNNGVAVDEYCRTSLPGIFAIGDCALHANDFADGARVRLESVQNATDQANVVARYLCGQPTRYASAPWFWSNQYELRLQTIGLSIGYDRVVLRGEPSSRRFSLVYLKAARVIALDCVNAPMDFIQGKALVSSRAIVDPELLRDAAVPLKSLTANAAPAVPAVVSLVSSLHEQLTP